MGLYGILTEKARSHGFPLSGGVDVDSVLGPQGHALDAHVSRYDSWLAGGCEGEMSYLRRGRDRRADPRLVYPKTRSVFCVAMPYWREGIGGGTGGPRYARYLKGTDYHDQIAEKLERMLEDARTSDPLLASLEWKVCVDTSAVLERSWAALSGLGWIGKNTTLIHPRLGSYLFLAEALLSEPLGRGPSPLPNYCGHCTRCLDACPTRAFTAPGFLDARKCISYWTLEKRGSLPLTEEEREGIGPWVAGCDICQEVCPFNTKPSRERIEEPASGDAVALTDWLTLLRESPEEYHARARESALSRVKPAQFSRNLALALANADPSAWSREIRDEARRRARGETDEAARAEWARCLQRMSEPL